MLDSRGVGFRRVLGTHMKLCGALRGMDRDTVGGASYVMFFVIDMFCSQNGSGFSIWKQGRGRIQFAPQSA